jgi:heavy metal sensor kinase
MDRLSSRLAAVSAILTAVLLGAVAAGVLLWMREMLERDLVRTLESECRSLRQDIARDLQADARDLPPELAQELSQSLDSSGSRARLRGPEGRVLFESPGPDPEGSVERSERFDIGSRGPYELRVSRSAAPVRERIHDLALFMAVLVPVAVVLSGLLSWVILRRALAPIDVVRLEAEQISRTNVSHRIGERWSSGDVRDLVRTFNAMLGRLEAAFEDLNNFAADAAHELRTPLATLRAEIEIAIQSSPTLEEYEEILKSFQAEVSRMSRVVSDLFTLARLDRGQHVLEMERTRLAPLVEETLETWLPVAQTRGISLRSLGGDAEVRGNAVALRRVLMNLVENALKYNRDGGDVVVSLDRRGDRAVLNIRDTGIGIAPEDLEKLFQRFFRVDRARSRASGGAGLGLAICKSFVTAHGGSIRVSSTPGQGSVFSVELPLDENPAGPPASEVPRAGNPIAVPGDRP